MFKRTKFKDLDQFELETVQGGGFIVAFLAIGAAAAVGVAIYKAGKAVGEFLYHVTNESQQTKPSSC